MPFILFILFIVVPFVELALLIWLSSVITIWPTIGFVVGTALLGAFVGKRQGLRALRRAQEDLQAGRLPAESLLDGLVILIASILLITPGVITDIISLLLFIPPLRAPLRRFIRRKFEGMLQEGTVQFLGPGAFNPFGAPFAGFHQGEEIIDITPVDRPEDSTDSGSTASLRELGDS